MTDSAGTQLLKVQDDGIVNLGTLSSNGGSVLFKNASGSLTYGEISVNSGSGEMKIGATRNSYFPTFYSSGVEAMRIDTDQFVGIGETTPTAKLDIKGSGATSATYALKAQNSGGETMFSIRNDKTIQIDGSRFTFNSSAFTSYADILLNTDLAVGTTTKAANTRAHIKGEAPVEDPPESGTFTNPTALLVENSAGTDLFKVTDDGNVYLPGKTYFSGLGIIIENNKIYSSNTGNGFIQLTSNNLEYSDTGTSGKEESAALTLTSTTRGFLPPRMTSEQKTAISSPAAGLMVYDTDANQMSYFNGTGWVNF